MPQRTRLYLTSIGIVLIAAQAAAAWPRRHHRRCVCPISRQAPAATLTTTASEEVEQVLNKLRLVLPNKTDDEIIQVLRGYVLHEDSADKDGLRWLAERLQLAKRQREAVAAIRATGGGDVFYDWQHVDDGQPIEPPPGPLWARNALGDDFFASAVYVYLHSPRISDAAMEHVRALPQLKELWLFNSEITDAGLRHLKDLKKLEKLGHNSAKVTDAGLSHLKSLSQLKVLALNNTQITDAGLEHLKDLKQLHELFLIDTQITDAGLKRLRGLTQLWDLRLGGTKVTDAGLQYLKGLSELYWLWLDNTKVTDAGVRKLQQALPKCMIEWTPPTKDERQSPAKPDQPGG